MSNTPNYKESNVTGTQWQRATRIVIENPFGGIPTVNFIEEKATQLGESVITQLCANLIVAFDPGNPAHLDLYDKLNSLYTVAREARDAAR